MINFFIGFLFGGFFGLLTAALLGANHYDD